jgi:hypothetical protein
VQHRCNLLLLPIHVVAFVTDLCITQGWTPVVMSVYGNT